MDKKRKWGELPSVPDVDAGIAAVEREQLTKLRPIEVEGPRLHQPSSRHCPPTNDPLPAERFELDPLTAHTIRLVQHAKKVRLLISNLQTANQENRNGDTDIQYPTAPPIPEYSGPTLKHNKFGHLPFVPKDYESDFVRGKGEPPPVLDDITCRRLVQRSVAAIFAHLGFDNCNESVLDTLSCVLHEFYLQFTTHLRSAVDSKLLHGHAGFPDLIEQVFHEMKLGSVTNLNDYYQSRIINYSKNMEHTCQQLMQEYEKLMQPAVTQKTLDTVPVIRIKEEPSSEIQFPVFDENDDITDEHLLQLEGLSGFEITVEHEPTVGLTTESDSKWTVIKIEPPENKLISLDSYDEQGSIKSQPPQTPSHSDGGDSIADPASVPVSDIMSPPSEPPKLKKRKK
ncbi:SUPT7L [Mytilus edulis]|uniref:SUPT7L n=1 Tax=Mytilus edulis TaxID=6550 RepID=A0A8S3QXR9_MYTED|nr:SUPT7L [Mytilus edulis]